MQDVGTVLKIVPPIGSCGCGCGEDVKKGRRFISGHNSRVMSDEIRKSMGKSNLGRVPSQETINKRKATRELSIRGESSVIPSPIRCACDCGGFVKTGRKFITGHNSKTIIAKEKLSILRKGNLASNETKRKMIEARKGCHHSKETKDKIGLGNKGKKISNEHKAILSKKLLGKKLSDETKIKIGLSQKGERGSNWQGGISFLPYSLEWTSDLKKFIKNRDNNECQNPYCDHKSKKLDVHHIDYDKQNCSQFNLITLCSPHHVKTNFNRKLWEVFYNKIIWSKYL